MKSFVILVFIMSLISGSAMASETTTECPMMKEMSRRTNPKAALAVHPIKKPSSATKKGTAI